MRQSAWQSSKFAHRLCHIYSGSMSCAWARMATCRIRQLTEATRSLSDAPERDRVLFRMVRQEQKQLQLHFAMRGWHKQVREKLRLGCAFGLPVTLRWHSQSSTGELNIATRIQAQLAVLAFRAWRFCTMRQRTCRRELFTPFRGQRYTDRSSLVQATRAFLGWSCFCFVDFPHKARFITH